MIIYIGNFVEPSQEHFICEVAHARRVISIDSFQKMFLAGVEQAEYKFDYIFNVPDIGSYPKFCRNVMIPGGDFEFEGSKGKNIPFLNIPYLKKYSIAHNLQKALIEFLSNVDSKEDVVIVVSTLYFQLIKPAIFVKSCRRNVKICSIVYDLPDMLSGRLPFMIRIANKFFNTIQYEYECVEKLDALMLLSPYMLEKLKSMIPFCVIEGIYNEKLYKYEKIDKEIKTILYTGTLDSRYGINELIDAFMMIPDSDFNLWICGDGFGRNYVEDAAKTDKRIKYFGIVNQQQVFQMQKQASLLVNPRKPSQEYTKYSFPSKTMEYMASGTPTIMYKLPALPEDYCSYLILLPDESLETFSSYMYNWGCKSQKELDNYGREAQKFILENKTAKQQATRFFEFLKDTFVNDKRE